MKKTVIIVSIFVMFFVFVSVAILGGQPVYAKAKVLRLVVSSPAGDWPLTYSNEELAKRFNKRATGEYKIEVHPGGALAKIPEYFDAVRIGAIEMACSAWPMFSFLDPRLGITELPFLFTSSPATSASCKPLLPLYDQILQEKFNAKGLGIMNVGGMQLWSTKPIKTLEEWKGVLIGAISPPAAGMIKALGGSPVTIMWTDLYESLQKKVIDATCLNTHAALVMSVPQVCKNLTIFYGISSWQAFSINLDIWKKMPKNIQQILLEEAAAICEMMNEITDTKLGKDDVKKFKDMGVKVYILPKYERDRWEKKLNPIKEKEFASFGEFGQKVKKVADDVNSRYPYSEEGLY
jgi:TRAP-type C4-dicarboxylate transport system substrate-binding protein